MRGLLVGATIFLAFIVGVVGASAAHAEGPPTSEEEAPTQTGAGRGVPVSRLSARSGYFFRDYLEELRVYARSSPLDRQASLGAAAC